MSIASADKRDQTLALQNDGIALVANRLSPRCHAAILALEVNARFSGVAPPSDREASVLVKRSAIGRR